MGAVLCLTENISLTPTIVLHSGVKETPPDIALQPSAM
jgi:hypothetical protein